MPSLNCRSQKVEISKSEAERFMEVAAMIEGIDRMEQHENKDLEALGNKLKLVACQYGAKHFDTLGILKQSAKRKAADQTAEEAAESAKKKAGASADS